MYVFTHIELFYGVKMRTTVILDDETYRATKAAAASLGTSTGSVIETALREFLERLATPIEELPPLITFRGGPRPGIDIDRTSALIDALEANDRAHA